MSERLTPGSDSEDKKTLRERMRDSKILASLAEHSPAVIFGAGLLISGRSQDIRPAAIGGAVYFLHKHVTEKVLPQIEEHKEEKRKKQLKESLPQTIRADLATMGIVQILELEEEIVATENPVLDNFILNMDEGYEKISIVTKSNSDHEEEEGDEAMEDVDDNFKIGLWNQEDYSNFKDGVLMAQYVLRTKLGKNLSEISPELLHMYNTDLLTESVHCKGGILTYLSWVAGSNLKDQETFMQFNDFVNVTVEQNEILMSGGIYLLGLYESQKEIDSLEEQLNLPPNESQQ